MKVNVMPTEIGKRKYPPDGIYAKSFYGGYACTCKEGCPFDCKGECGCEACYAAWNDYLSRDF